MERSVRCHDAFSDYKRNEQEEMLVAPPLDLSYKKASNLNGTKLTNSPRDSFNLSSYYLFDINNDSCDARELAVKRAQTIRTGRAPARTEKDRFVTSSLWLSNNYFTSMNGLEDFVKKTLDDYIHLCWLDLSFNEIEEIADEIARFPNLKIFYLHGNNISDINDVTKLKGLRNLRSFTLHGNPVENVPEYRSYVVHILPQLTAFDFSPVLAAERKKPLPVGFHKMTCKDT